MYYSNMSHLKTIKMCGPNAANAISGIQILKVFWAGVSSDFRSWLVPLPPPPLWIASASQDYSSGNTKAMPYLLSIIVPLAPKGSMHVSALNARPF